MATSGIDDRRAQSFWSSDYRGRVRFPRLNISWLTLVPNTFAAWKSPAQAARTEAPGICTIHGAPVLSVHRGGLHAMVWAAHKAGYFSCQFSLKGWMLFCCCCKYAVFFYTLGIGKKIRYLANGEFHVRVQDTVYFVEVRQWETLLSPVGNRYNLLSNTFCPVAITLACSSQAEH